jgi:uncharacterized membrane protein
MTVDLSELLPMLASATLVVGGIAAALVAIRRWIRNVARPAQAAADQLATSDGHTIAQYVEQVAGDVTELKASSRDNRTLIGEVSRRLDDHITRGHGS